MSPRLGPRRDAGEHARDHERARELAASRLDEPLSAGDAARLDDHLAGCPACRAVAAEYAEGRLFLRAHRDASPEPPRDLWARTAAALEVEGARRSRGTVRTRLGRRAPLAARPLAPVAGLLIVAIAVGVGLLNGRNLLPGATSGAGPMPTPINVTAAEVQVVSHGEDGTVLIMTRHVDQVCPVGTAACGLSAAFDVTTTATIHGSADLDAIISPSRDRVVVVERGAGASGVFVLNVATPAPDASRPPVATADPARTAAPTPVAIPAPTATAVTASSGDPATPDPSEVVSSPSIPPAASPDTTSDPAATDPPASDAPASPAPTPDPTVGLSPDPGAPSSPAATPDPSAEGPEPTPPVAVSPAPDGALEIASGVIVVGGIAAYAPDGSRFAFAARPKDGSAGPDVYVWTVGDPVARPVTNDHASVFAGWMDGRLLVSRVVDGQPRTVLLDLVDGTVTDVGAGPMWRPTVGPGQRTAIWWDGSVTLGADGVTYVPTTGRLVLDDWPAADSNPQVLATGPLADWDIKWDAEGTVVAVWTSTGGPGAAGSLSLYAIEPGTGRADLARPLLDGASAFAGYSLEPGRLAWSAPAEGGDTTVQVLAWSGDAIGRLELPSEQGVTVVR